MSSETVNILISQYHPQKIKQKSKKNNITKYFNVRFKNISLKN